MPPKGIELDKILKIFAKSTEDKKDGSSLVSENERKLLCDFFSPELITRVCKRYGLDPEKSPMDTDELSLILLGVATNLDPSSISVLAKNFNNRQTLITFLDEHIWGLCLNNECLEKAKKCRNRVLSNLKDKPRLADVQSAMEMDFMGKWNRLGVNFNATEAALVIKNKLTDQKVNVLHSDAPKPSEKEVVRLGDKSDKNKIGKSIQSEFVSKNIGYAKVYTEKDANVIVPIPNGNGDVELYQVKCVYNEKGLAYNILAVLPPKLYSDSSDIVIVFKGTDDRLSLQRDLNTTGFQLTPGKEIFNLGSMGILKNINQVIKDLDHSASRPAGNNASIPQKYYIEVCGHSLAGADAQSLVTEILHVDALQLLATPDGNNSNKQKKLDLKQAVDATPEVKRRLEETQKRMQGHEKDISEMDRLKIDMQVWGAPGVSLDDNKSTCVLLDKLNKAPEVNLQFSYVEGEMVKSVGTHLGSLGNQKDKADTEKDFRPKGEGFHRHKVIWDKVPLKNKHMSHVYTEILYERNQNKKSNDKAGRYEVSEASKKETRAEVKIRAYHNKGKPKPIIHAYQKMTVEPEQPNPKSSGSGPRKKAF